MKPNALTVFSSINDTRNGTKITRTGAIEAYKLLERGESVRLERHVVPPTEEIYNLAGELVGRLGERGTCFHTSLYCADQFGGKVVYGWLVYRHPRGFRCGSNDYGNLEMGAHAVWQRPDGQHCEVTDVPVAAPGFFPHNRVKDKCQVSIHFTDRYGDGKLIKTVEILDLMEVRLT